MDDSPSISSKKMDLPQAPPTTSIPRFTPENEQMEIEDEGYSDTLPTQMEIWDHFTPYTDNNGKTRANCKYCDKVYDVDASNNVTSAMNNHRKACNNHPHNAYVADNQAIASSCRSVTEDSSEFSSHWKFDQEATRKALARMVIIDKLPFKFVEKEGFRQFVSVACPQFIVPSRTTIIEDCY
ncbi:zinc finger BED domain-containing protein RICESLEEPER 4-like, partial [Sesamum indicum]|uniref:Zinc finger BED domain-containing protein RICESLEEPER 4-like n=1 Tax=Sesamum indicum TaxID=4182 RepID=A0A6I9SIR1_SESIN